MEIPDCIRDDDDDDDQGCLLIWINSHNILGGPMIFIGGCCGARPASQLSSKLIVSHGARSEEGPADSNLNL